LAQRDAQKAVAIKAAGAKWNPKAWDPAAVLADYLPQRLEHDEHFRRILKDVKASILKHFSAVFEAEVVLIDGSSE
jgi:ATP-dependent protease HslVU (ClpYQ) ATPase subunit